MGRTVSMCTSHYRAPTHRGVTRAPENCVVLNGFSRLNLSASIHPGIYVYILYVCMYIYIYEVY